MKPSSSLLPALLLGLAQASFVFKDFNISTGLIVSHLPLLSPLP